jgi:ATP-dependent Clp protease ATP-binding subunit ClpE
MAVIFINKLDKNGKNTGESTGLCLDCAKKQGINPMQNIMNEMEKISPEDLENMSKQFDSMLGSFGISGEELDDTLDVDDEENKKSGFNFQNIFSGIMPNSKKDQESDDKENNDSTNLNQKKSKKKNKYLDTYGENLTEKARQGKLDKVIGRRRELDRMIQILNRRSKNNPALIGEPGVGKTAIINALAQEIVAENVPSKLINKEVYLIDMTSLVAGTQFRGQFESRVKGLINECKSLGNIILAIDEVHNIVGGLEHDNSMNAANMLKPALANGAIQLIGATTLTEYRKYIEKDTALERRFQPVIVDEPSQQECIEILKGIKEYYENFHKVKISDEILKQSVILSEKYIHDRYLPDKAIDLLDEACARVNLENVMLAKIEKLQKKLDRIIEEEELLEEEIKNNEDSDSNVENYEKAAKVKEEHCKIQTKLDEMIKDSKPEEVTIDNLARVIELWTKIPVAKVKTSETEKLLNLKDNLRKRIISQDQAIESISNAIIRKRANIRNIDRPPSFIFVGPTGVGKTQLVKELAYELFDNKESVIKLDMSEYMEQNSTSKLIGSPPGYVGYDEAGQLTEKVRRNPYSIILFDEIEKAHPSVYNILLQILDDGKLTDSQGKSVSFKHSIIILTSNLGTNFKSDGYGFSNSKIEEDTLESKTRDALKEFFKPEFLNRIDEIITFNKLSKDSLKEIAILLIKELQDETKQRHILFDYTPAVIDYIITKGYDEKFGARPLRRAIQKYIEDMMAIEYIKGNVKEDIPYSLDVVNQNIVITNIN